MVIHCQLREFMGSSWVFISGKRNPIAIALKYWQYKVYILKYTNQIGTREIFPLSIRAKGT